LQVISATETLVGQYIRKYISRTRLITVIESHAVTTISIVICNQDCSVVIM